MVQNKKWYYNIIIALPIQGHNNIDRDDVKIMMIHVFDNACL